MVRGVEYDVFWAVPFGHYDEPETLPYAIRPICPIGADVRQFGSVVENIIFHPLHHRRTPPFNLPILNLFSEPQHHHAVACGI